MLRFPSTVALLFALTTGLSAQPAFGPTFVLGPSVSMADLGLPDSASLLTLEADASHPGREVLSVYVDTADVDDPPTSYVFLRMINPSRPDCRERETSVRHGVSVSSTGDLNADGRDDVLVLLESGATTVVYNVGLRACR